MHKFHSLSIVLILMIAFSTGCSNEFEYGSPFRCYFCFDNMIHQNATMASAVTPNSNTFVRVQKRKKGEINYVLLDMKGKEIEEVPITTERENFARYSLGGNEAIVIGFNTLNESLVAYDGMCRYCYEQKGLYITLSWETGTTMRCAKCGKIYNLLLNGISDDKEPVKLWKYHVSASDPYGIIAVGG